MLCPNALVIICGLSNFVERGVLQFSHCLHKLRASAPRKTPMPQDRAKQLALSSTSISNRIVVQSLQRNRNENLGIARKVHVEKSDKLGMTEACDWATAQLVTLLDEDARGSGRWPPIYARQFGDRFRCVDCDGQWHDM